MSLRKYYDYRPVSGWIEKNQHKSLIGLYTKLFNTEPPKDRKTEYRPPKWIFRGQCDGSWGLETSLDRAFDKYGIRARLEDNPEVAAPDRRDVERKMIRSFMRKAHLYLAHPPEQDDLIEWLALMRHYGAPTRMLDWTYSFYVAVYNAVEGWNPVDPTYKSNDEKRWPTVWALDANQLQRNRLLSHVESTRSRHIDASRHGDNRVLRYLMESPMSLVYNATGFRLNDRLTAQQGTFLIQGDLGKSFEDNLKKSLPREPKKHFYRIGLEISRSERDRILAELNNMNINHGTLYPGLEGFTQSLERHLAYPQTWGLYFKKTYD